MLRTDFLFVKLVACWWFVSHLEKLILFMELVVFGFVLIELETCWFLFIKLVVSWLFSSWNLNTNFFFVKSIFIIELVAYWFLFVKFVACLFLFKKLVICWFFSFWKLHIDISHCETGFAHGACCVLLFVHGDCCLLIFASGIYYILIFLSVKCVHWYFPLWNWFS